MASVASILNEITKLTAIDKEILIERLLASVSTTDTLESVVSDARFSKGLICPYCGKTHVIRHGKRKDGVQRFGNRSRSCISTFR